MNWKKFKYKAGLKLSFGSGKKKLSGTGLLSILNLLRPRAHLRRYGDKPTMNPTDIGLQTTKKPKVISDNETIYEAEDV